MEATKHKELKNNPAEMLIDAYDTASYAVGMVKKAIDDGSGNGELAVSVVTIQQALLKLQSSVSLLERAVFYARLHGADAQDVFICDFEDQEEVGCE